MKSSRFNIIKHQGEDAFIYNTYTGSILHLNAKYTKKYQLAENMNFENTDFGDLIENLKKGNMIVEDNVNETDLLLAHNSMARFSDLVKNYTIAPTMKCNFICPYCYEKGVDYKTMDRKTIDAVKNLFKQDKEVVKMLSIAWYGGEPLVSFDIIEELSLEGIRLFGENYTASMVTNGYLLTPEIARKLDELKIDNIQITIDGPPDIHNARRKLQNGKDTFFVILQNIKEALEIAKNLQITIRVNTDKTNIERTDEIIQYLEEYGVREKVGLYLAPVDNINDTCNATECFDNHEFAMEQIQFIKKNMKRNYNFAYLPRRNTNICGAVSGNCYVIDAVGDIYKCWDDVGNKDKSAGSIFDSEQRWNENMTKWLAYNIAGDKECMDCGFLPVCMGGCPNFRIKDGKKRCSPIKENANEMIQLLYEYYKKAIN